LTKILTRPARSNTQLAVTILTQNPKGQPTYNIYLVAKDKYTISLIRAFHKGPVACAEAAGHPSRSEGYLTICCRSSHLAHGLHLIDILFPTLAKLEGGMTPTVTLNATCNDGEIRIDIKPEVTRR
ncbi:unnamed protein product, partial [Rhizoctonia solani]